MKKIFLFILPMLFAGNLFSQQTFWTPGIPPGSNSFTPSFRSSGTDSLANLYFSNGTKWWQSYTATQSNLRFLRKSDSVKFITPWQLYHGNNTVTGDWNIDGQFIFNIPLSSSPQIPFSTGNGSHIASIRLNMSYLDDFAKIIFSTNTNVHSLGLVYLPTDEGPGGLGTTRFEVQGTGITDGQSENGLQQIAYVSDLLGTIKNSTSQQHSANFNIEGNGTVGAKFSIGDTTRDIQLTDIGTSITAASGNANINLPDSGYAYKFGRTKGLKVYNLGLSGRKMQMVSGTDSSLYNKRYSLIPFYKNGDYLMIEISVNDALSDSTIFTRSIYRTQLDSCVKVAITDRGFPANHIILASSMAYYNQPTSVTYPHNEERHDEYAYETQAEATTKGTLFYDDYYDFKALYLADNALLFTDILHPTPKGHTVIANRFSSWFTQVTTIPFTPPISKTVGSAEVYGDLQADQNINVANDMRIWGRIFSTGSRGVIVGDGLSPTVPNNIGGLTQPQFTVSSSTGTAALAVNASTLVNNGSASLLINDTAWGLSTSVSTTARPFVLRNVSTDWLKINTSGIITTGNWGATPITHAFGGTDNTSYTNGELLIGNSTGNGLTKATLTGNTASGLVITNGAGSVTISVDNSKYIQNTTSQQTGSNFNISGNGTVAGTILGGIVKTGTGAFGGSRSLGAASIFTPTIGNSVTSGIAGVQAIVNDGTINRRTTLIANNTDGVAGISVDFSSGGAIPIVIAENNVEFARWSSTGALTVGGTITLKGYTVATLPTGITGMTAYVTDALTPVALGTVTGGGSSVVPVFYNGTHWIVQ